MRYRRLKIQQTEQRMVRQREMDQMKQGFHPGIC